MTIDLDKFIKPMTINESKPFDNDDYIYELKFDGHRALIYIDKIKNKTTIYSKRGNKVTYLYPELANLHNDFEYNAILDGELVALKDGRPNFQKLQARASKKDKFKILLTNKLNPVTFVCFDILYFNDNKTTHLPLLERKKILENNFKNSNLFILIKYINKYGIEFYNAVSKENLEGIVAKHKFGKYFTGKRSPDWFKFKAIKDIDLIVCGYKLDNNDNISSLLLGAYKNNNLIYATKVAFSGKKNIQIKLKEFYKKNKVAPYFDNFKNYLFIKPKIVCTINYLEKTEKGAYRHAFFKSLREDLDYKECLLI